MIISKGLQVGYLRFSDVFRAYKKGTPDSNGFKIASEKLCLQHHLRNCLVKTPQEETSEITVRIHQKETFRCQSLIKHLVTHNTTKNQKKNQKLTIAGSILLLMMSWKLELRKLFRWLFCLVRSISQILSVMAGANQSNISSNIFSACLTKRWIKNYVFHMTNFLVCTRSSNIPSNIRTFIHS